ncbi:MAG TPA: M20/M25/M40 family metallo-hydrolase [Myxococcales bacterium]|jgi:acetylornithine deacetylase/succinyl-diaminopimelate desuccinylase-like protein
MSQLPTTAADEALALLGELVRVDTSNPPGREAPAAQLLADRLKQDGYEPTIVEAEPGRSNLVVRRKGDGTGGAPLLLTGHLDVVAADPAGWKHPPFAGEIADGFLWGRGAVDMKNHLAACATVMRQLAAQSVPLKRDVIFAAVADEEATCRLGSRFLVEKHPDLIRAEFALGEAGGFTIPMDGKRLYPIQVAHKGVAWLTMRATGPTGHGSVPRSDSAPMRLARAVMRLGNMPLPIHVTNAARGMFDGLAAALGGGTGLTMKLLKSPSLADFTLTEMIGDVRIRGALGAALRNTASVTGLRASGGSPNVFPGVAEATVDGRLLPGQTIDQFLEELGTVVDDDAVTFQVDSQLEAAEAPFDTPLFRRLQDSVKAMDPDGRPFPYLVPGASDAGPLSKLGIRTYGFTPVVWPEGAVSPAELPHAVDERIPVEGFKRGVQALWDVVVGFCQ